MKYKNRANPCLVRVTAIWGEQSTVNVDTEWLYETVRQRVLAADSTRHEPDYIERQASREYIFSAIDGAMEKFGDAAPKRSRVIPGIKPHFVRKTVTVAAGQERIKKSLARIFD